MKKIYILLLVLITTRLFAQPFNRILAESHTWAIATPMGGYSLVFDSLAHIYFDADSSDVFNPVLPGYNENFNNAGYIVKAQSDSSTGKFIAVDYNMDFHSFTHSTYLTHDKPLYYSRLMYDSVNGDSFLSDEQFFTYDVNQRLLRDSLNWSSTPGASPFEGSITYNYTYDVNGNMTSKIHTIFSFGSMAYYPQTKFTYDYDISNTLTSSTIFGYDGIGAWDSAYHHMYYYSPTIDSVIIWRWNTFLPTPAWVVFTKEYYHKNINGLVDYIRKDDYSNLGFEDILEESFKFYGLSGEYLGDSTRKYYLGNLDVIYRENVQLNAAGQVIFISADMQEFSPSFPVMPYYTYEVLRDALGRPNQVTYRKTHQNIPLRLFNLDKYYWDGYTLGDGMTTSVLPILLFPNPSHESVIVSLPEVAKKICIYDLNGRMVHQVNQLPAGNLYLDIHAWVNATYIIHVLDQNNRVTHSSKFIKN